MISALLWGFMLVADNAVALPSHGEASSVERLSKRQTSTFDADDQRISTTGKHAWVAPDFAAGDQRGPCPGLNALANHGYLPHSGVATALEFDAAITQVPRIGFVFSKILAFYGLATAGDGISWSIGSKPKSGLLSPLLNGLGLDGTHNVYEGDASAVRGDLYTSDNNFQMQLPLFKQLYFGSDGKPRNIDLQTLSDHRASRFQDSIETNPYFFAGPVSSQVTAAAHHFIFRLMGNKSMEFPEGQTTPEVFKSWFAVSGPDDDLQYTPGHERIPDNFYTRPSSNPYEVNLFAADLAYFILDHPETASIGGNAGEVNTFTGVDITNLTGGVFNAATLGEGNNAACFGLNVLLVGAASVLRPLLQPALGLLGCPTISDSIDSSKFAQYPGFADLGKGGAY